jgi:hypothetical protein
VDEVQSTVRMEIVAAVASAQVLHWPLSQLEGSVEFGIDNGEPFILKAGDAWYEPPGALHSVSGNASQTSPCLLAFFVLADGQEPTVPDDA